MKSLKSTWQARTTDTSLKPLCRKSVSDQKFGWLKSPKISKSSLTEPQYLEDEKRWKKTLVSSRGIGKGRSFGTGPISRRRQKSKTKISANQNWADSQNLQKWLHGNLNIYTLEEGRRRLLVFPKGTWRGRYFGTGAISQRRLTSTPKISTIKI